MLLVAAVDERREGIVGMGDEKSGERVAGRVLAVGKSDNGSKFVTNPSNGDGKRYDDEEKGSRVVRARLPVNCGTGLKEDALRTFR